MITYYADGAERAAAVVADLLGRLDRAARELFPAWLPAAAPIDSAAGAGTVAVRSIALRSARHSGRFGPFLADLAERSLRFLCGYGSAATLPRARFNREIRARELSRVIAASYGRRSTVILVRVPAGLTEVQESALVAAARWLTDSGGFGIWFTGEPLHAADTVDNVPAPPSPGEPPAHARPVHGGRREPAPAGITHPAPTGIRYPALAGRPHPASEAERALEAALAAAEWAAGREWNRHHQVHPLVNPVRLDLVWRPERLVVEIDGAEHRAADHYASDRQRDVLLQLAGYAVLRFTNDQVTGHRELVLAQIREFLSGRRTGRYERVLHD
ncbi:DUF559 domain-containing protein [Actinoplanes sp. NPDC051851]|uniref:endonuclease domain-containing protein n=1 Tax=Actinoplanes sp. NPDC051851 TaxID=3154753 RepID=UPI0034123A7A